MGGVVNVQKPSAVFSISAFGPLQKLTRTFSALGALIRISTRELPSTRGYCASRTLDDAGLKSPDSCAKQKGATSIIINPIRRIGLLKTGPGIDSERGQRYCTEVVNNSRMNATKLFVTCTIIMAGGLAPRLT